MTENDTDQTDEDRETRETPSGTPHSGSAAERDRESAADYDYADDDDAPPSDASREELQDRFDGLANRPADYDPDDDIVRFESETSGVDADGIADVPDADDYNPEDHPEDFVADYPERDFVGDPGLLEDDADDARLDPQGIDIELPENLREVEVAAWNPDRRERVREMLTHSNLPRGYHIRAYVNTVTGEIHEIVAAPDEGAVMDTPNVVSKRDGAGKYVEPTLAPRERGAIYEVRFDPDEFVTTGDIEVYEEAVRERHAERLAETAGVQDPMDLPAESHEVYWAEAVVEDRDLDG